MKKLSTILLAMTAAVALSGCIETSHGDKIGTITKIAKQGVLCKTWEAEIIRGTGFNNGAGANGQSFHFTVRDEATAKALEASMVAGQEIKIEYTSEWATFCSSDSNNFLKSYTVLNAPKPKVDGVVATAAGIDPTVAKLLQVQAQLIQELAAKVGN